MRWSNKTRLLYFDALRVPKDRLSPDMRVLMAAMRRADEYAADVLTAAAVSSLTTSTASAEASPITTILLKPVGDTCNLACGYCYEAERARSRPQGRMTIDTLRAVLDNLLPYIGRPFSIFVHGGEPLLRGLPFFEELVFRTRQLSGDSVRFGVQTNATLIDRRWAEFFATNKFQVGVSLDGPESINDLQRPTACGGGSHGDVMRGIKELRSAGADFGLICMVTGQLAAIDETPARLYNFFYNAGIRHFDIHPALTPALGSRDFNVSPHDFALFMTRLFDVWLEGGDPDVSLRTIDHFFQGMTGVPAAACYRSGMCTSIVGVEPNGDVAPCTRPFPARYTFGSLVRERLPEIQQSPSHREFAVLELAGQQKTSDCEWAALCGSGGCPHERVGSDGFQAVDGIHTYCTCHAPSTGGGYPSVFRYFRSRVESLLRATTEPTKENTNATADTIQEVARGTTPLL